MFLLLYRMRDSLTLTRRNSIAPLHQPQPHNTMVSSPGTGLYSSITSSHNVSDFILSGPGQHHTNHMPTFTDSSAAVSHAVMEDSGLHENLFLHPEMHNPIHHTGSYRR